MSWLSTSNTVAILRLIFIKTQFMCQAVYKRRQSYDPHKAYFIERFCCSFVYVSSITQKVSVELAIIVN